MRYMKIRFLVLLFVYLYFSLFLELYISKILFVYI